MRRFLTRLLLRSRFCATLHTFPFFPATDRYEASVAAWQYVQCLLDTFLALSTLSLCWAALRSGSGTLRKRRQPSSEDDTDRLNGRILIVAALQATLAVLAIPLHVSSMY